MQTWKDVHPALFVRAEDTGSNPGEEPPAQGTIHPNKGGQWEDWRNSWLCWHTEILPNNRLKKKKYDIIYMVCYFLCEKS